jgi:hypothetical protein
MSDRRLRYDEFTNSTMRDIEDILVKVQDTNICIITNRDHLPF